VTGAGDETLRFWKVFPSKKENPDGTYKSLLVPSCFDLR
jgi:WD40 repeat protein